MQQNINAIPQDIVCSDDYERYAKDILEHSVYEYIASGVADEKTLNNNRLAFDALQIMPKALQRFDTASTATSLLGHTLQQPFLLAPVAHQKLVHEQGEIATAKAAHAMNVGMVASTHANVTLEAIAQQTQAPTWFQLYFQSKREHTLQLVTRAEKAGYSAIVATIDAPVSGLRNRTQRAGFALNDTTQAVNLIDHNTRKPFQTETIAINENESLILHGCMSQAPTWADIQWLLQQTSLPIIIKGIINPQDAAKAQSLGVHGIVVSNHGGRTLDGLPATIRMLPIIRQHVGNDFPLILDSGIRRGTDIFKALALGAHAVMIGRPQLYALAVAGALGVAHMLRLFTEEFAMTMALAGCPTVADIQPHCIYT